MSVPRSRPGLDTVRNAGDECLTPLTSAWLTPPTGRWLTPLTGHWLEAARAHLAGHAAVVRVTVVALRGSAPREPGASMLVDASGTVGTIGGGRLEWHATRAARELLRARDAAPVRIDDLLLGPQLGQCCGGRVELWLERLTRDDLPWLHPMAGRLRTGSGTLIATEFAGGVVSHRLLRSTPGAAAPQLRRSEPDHVTLFEMLSPQRPRLWIFGAGHVGQALVRLLSELALFEITWIDSRDELLPANLPECVTTHACAAPPELIGAARAATRYVVLTHDHGLDYELCRLILMRGDAAWLGLIGSASKSARFRSRLLRNGVSAELLAGLTCPIGIPGVASKLPAAIAIAIAAQLLQKLDPGPAPEFAVAAAQSASPPAQIAGDDQQPCSAACASCGSGRPREA
jgi:xanthine dehydrogenase accessory factor